MPAFDGHDLEFDEAVFLEKARDILESHSHVRLPHVTGRDLGIVEQDLDGITTVGRGDVAASAVGDTTP